MPAVLKVFCPFTAGLRRTIVVRLSHSAARNGLRPWVAAGGEIAGTRFFVEPHAGSAAQATASAGYVDAFARAIARFAAPTSQDEVLAQIPALLTSDFA